MEFSKDILVDLLEVVLWELLKELLAEVLEKLLAFPRLSLITKASEAVGPEKN